MGRYVYEHCLGALDPITAYSVTRIYAGVLGSICIGDRTAFRFELGGALDEGETPYGSTER